MNLAIVVTGAVVLALALILVRKAAAPRTSAIPYVNHSLTHGHVSLRVVASEASRSADDVDLAARLLTAHRAAMKDRPARPRSAADQWDVNAREYHGELFAALDRGDPDALATLLSGAFRQRFTVGIGGPWHLESDIGRPEANRYLATICADRAVSLAEALALVPVENPEQVDGVRDNLYRNIDELVTQIERRLGIELPSKAVAGFAGIPVGDGRLGFRTCEHAYVAHRLRELGGRRAPERRVCEIGGGYGGAAYYAWKMGLRDYAIFDLPHINVIQGYYLAKSLGGAAVSLFGESRASGSIAVLPHWLHAASPAQAFDIALNQDSFAELGPDTVAEYLAGIRRATSTFFLSINQEAQAPSPVPGQHQVWVSRLVDEAGGFRRVLRAPYWMRAGYVEEVFEIA